MVVGIGSQAKQATHWWTKDCVTRSSRRIMASLNGDMSWVVENSRSMSTKAYSSAASPTTASDELEVLETYVTMHSPTKGEHRKIKQVVNDVREKMSALEGKYDETKRLLTEMREVMVEQQQHIRTLQKQEALRQICVEPSDNSEKAVDESVPIDAPPAQQTTEDRVRATEPPASPSESSEGQTPRPKEVLLANDPNEALEGPIEPVAEAADADGTTSDSDRDMPSSSSSGENKSSKQQEVLALRKQVRVYKMKYREAHRSKEEAESTIQFWKRRCDSNKDTLKRLERIIEEQKKMIAPLTHRKGRRKNSIRIGRSHRRKKSSSTPFRSVEGSLELNLSWPPPSSSSEEEEEESEVGRQETVDLDAENDEQGGQDEAIDELTASQEHTFGLVQKFYGNDTEGDATVAQIDIEGIDDGLLSEDEEEED